MASNFAFRSFGMSQMVTVVATATTISFSIVNVGGSTVTVGPSGRYQPTAMRVANLGTATAFIQLGGDATVTVGVNTGMPIMGISIEYVSTRGTPFMAHISQSTTTLALTFGEGM